jgi:hypothetical protein
LFWFKLTNDYYSLITVVAGEVPEWLNGAVSKTVVEATPPRVRIPASPPVKQPGSLFRYPYLPLVYDMLYLPPSFM